MRVVRVAADSAPGTDHDGFLWIGPAGTLTPFHHDLTNNLLVQVKGRKRVHMVPNWEEARMKQTGRIFSVQAPSAVTCSFRALVFVSSPNAVVPR